MTAAERMRRYRLKHAPKPKQVSSIRSLIGALARQVKGKPDDEIRDIANEVADRLRRTMHSRSYVTSDFIHEVLEFTVEDFGPRLLAWYEAKPDLSAEDRTALVAALYQCAEELNLLAQKVDGR
jgi:hypothetical protein